MVIAIEGMDGVGKTMVSMHVHEKYGFEYISKPLNNFYGSHSDDKEMMDAARKIYEVESSALRSWYIGLGNIYAIKMNSDRNIVIDRHFVSNYYWNGDANSDPVFRALIETCGKPDLTIILYASVQERMNRIRKRNNSDPDLFDPEKYDDGLNKMLDFVEKFDIPYVLINTENKSLDEVNKIVDNYLEEITIKPRIRK